LLRSVLEFTRKKPDQRSSNHRQSGHNGVSGEAAALTPVSEPCADEVTLRLPIGIRRSDQEFAACFLSELIQAHRLPQDQFWDVRRCRLSRAGCRSVGNHRAPLGHHDTPTAASGRRFMVLGNCTVVREIALAANFAKRGNLEAGASGIPVVPRAEPPLDHRARIARSAIGHNASAVLAVAPKGKRRHAVAKTQIITESAVAKCPINRSIL
jgi:hypothetical protein